MAVLRLRICWLASPARVSGRLVDLHAYYCPVHPEADGAEIERLVESGVAVNVKHVSLGAAFDDQRDALC